MKWFLSSQVELCDLLAGLPLSYIDHVESSSTYTSAGGAVAMMSSLRQSDRFSHRVLTAVLIPLLADQDPRVRTAAGTACMKLVLKSETFQLPLKKKSSEIVLCYKLSLLVSKKTRYLKQVDFLVLIKPLLRLFQTGSRINEQW